MRFGFLINEVLTGLRRNVTMTIAMILTTAISIGLFGGGLLVVRLADNSRKIYLDRVESQVFLTNDVSADDPTCDGDPCKALRAKIEGLDEVKSVRFLNRDDAYNDAIKKFPQYKDVAGKEAFPASFIVKLDNPEQHKDFDAAMVGLSGKANRLPAELSGGEQQRVAIARAFVNRPLVLLADEPTGNLDPETSKDIMDLLERINRTGTTVVMATHDHHIVDSMRQRVVELDLGRLIRDEQRGVYGMDR